jgi:hypothetical protein
MQEFTLPITLLLQAAAVAVLALAAVVAQVVYITELRH